jgi:circadian clock protein KaiC
MGISSLIDTWIYLRDLETGGERNRGLYILKSRGTAHSNQIREFLLTRRGIELRQAYIGPEGVLTGSARLTQESRDQASALAQAQEIERQRRVLEGKRKALEAQIEALTSELHLATVEERIISGQETDRVNKMAADRDAMSRSRRVSTGSLNGKDGKKKRRGE